MKNILIGLVVIVVLILGWFLFLRDAGAIVGEELLVTRFESNGESTGKVLLQVPFVRSLKEPAVIAIAIDTDRNDAFDTEEMLVANFPARPRVDWRNGYYAVSDRTIEEGMAARVTLDGRDHNVRVVTKVVEMEALLDLASVTDPENATKGWGAAVAHAQSGEVTITQDNVPDLNQRKGECAPTAAANSLISLVAKNGGEDLIPGDPQDFIQNLKQYMDWTPENGVPPDDFVRGKNEWAAHAGVPIRTEKVGDTHGLSTIDAIREALERGDSAVELRIKFANPEGTKIEGGHMVTVTGIHQGETGTFLEINDPATPDSGTEQIKIENNQVVDYGPWRGITILSWGFVQTWEGHPTGELLDPMSDAEIQGIKQFVGEAEVIKVIRFRGAHIPISQLHIGEKHPPHDQGEGCPERHWHAAGEVTSVEGRTFTDPNPGGCGFGTLSQNPSIDYTLPPIEQPDEHGGIEIRGLENLRSQ